MKEKLFNGLYTSFGRGVFSLKFTYVFFPLWTPLSCRLKFSYKISNLITIKIIGVSVFYYCVSVLCSYSTIKIFPLSYFTDNR